MTELLTWDWFEDQSVEHGSHRKAAVANGWKKTTWNDTRWRLMRAQEEIDEDGRQDLIPAEPIPMPDLPVSEVVDHMVDTYKANKAFHEAWNWRTYNAPDNLPRALALFGDMHSDDPGCNWPLLKRDLELCAETSGLHCVNIGDLHNNWAGPLARLYANQNTSKSRAYELIRHILEGEWPKNSGRTVPWLLHLLGNHDVWGDGMDVLRQMDNGKGKHKFWEAKIKIAFPNGFEYPCHFAHNFKGTSIYNATQGSNKKALFAGKDQAKLYANGHIHSFGLSQHQVASGDVISHVQLCSYKDFDDHAISGGFNNNNVGACVLVVIDPMADNIATETQIFIDLPAGITYLNALRQTRQRMERVA